jgi:hypothetical protein
MFRLVGVAGYVVEVANIIRTDMVFFHGGWGIAIVTNALGEGDTRHGVYGNINVIGFDAQQLITNPAAGPSQNDGLRDISRDGYGGSDIEKQGPQLLLAGVKLD